MPDPCNERQVRFPARTPTNPATTPNPHNDAAQMGAGGVGADPRRAPNVTRTEPRRDHAVTAENRMQLLVDGVISPEQYAAHVRREVRAARRRAILEQSRAKYEAEFAEQRKKDARVDRIVIATIVAAATAATALLFFAFPSSAHAAPRPDTPHPLDYNQRTIARALPEWGIHALEQADASGWYWTPTRSVCVRTKPAHYRCDATGSWSTVGEPGVRVTYRLRYCTSSRRIGNHALYRDGAVWRARIRVDYRGGLTCRVPNPPYIPASGGAS